MQTILLNNELINVSDFSYFDYLAAKNDKYSISKKYIENEEEIAKCINKYSAVYKMFLLDDKDSFFSNYSFDKEFNTFKEAEETINNLIHFSYIFNKQINQEFEHDFCKKYKLKIIKNNRLMFVSKNKAIFDNNNKVKEFDFYNITLTFIDIFKIVNHIKYHQEAVELLCQLFNCNIVSNEMMLKIRERTKINNNLSMISQLDRYTYINRLIHKHTYILQAFHSVALYNSYKSNEHSQNGDLIILCTSDYLKEHLKRESKDTNNPIKIYSDSYIRRLLKLLSTLDLITIAEATENQKSSAKQSLKATQYKYYVIKEYTFEHLIKVESIAKKLVENQITAYNITDSKINKALYNVYQEKLESETTEFFYDFNMYQ